MANFREWREQYPVPVEFRIRRVTGSGDVWVRELSASYDGGPWMMGVGCSSSTASACGASGST